MVVLLNHIFCSRFFKNIVLLCNRQIIYFDNNKYVIMLIYNWYFSRKYFYSV